MNNFLRPHIHQLLSFILVLFSVISIAQIQPDKVYTTHNGLPQIQVQHIAMDSRGVCWINTKGGLAYFDGEFISEQKSQKGESFAGGSCVLKADNSVIFDSGNHLIHTNGSTTDTIYSDSYSNFKNRVVYHKEHLYLIAHDKEMLLTFNLDGHIIDSLKLDNRWCHMKEDGNVIYLNDINPKNEKYRVRTFKNNTLTNIYETTRILQMNPFTKNVSFMEYTSTDLNGDLTILNHKNQFKVAAKITRSNTRKLEIENVSPLPHDIWWVKDAILIKIQDDGFKEYTLSNKTHVFVLEDVDENVIVSNEHGLSVFLNHDFTTYPLDFLSDVWSMHKMNNKVYTSHFSEGLFEVDLENRTKKYIPFTDNKFRMYFGSSNSDEVVFFPGGKGFSILKNNNRKDFFDKVKIPNLLCSYYNISDNLFYSGGLNNILIFNPHTEKYQVVSDTSQEKPGYIIELKPKNDTQIWCGYWKGLKMYDIKEGRFENMDQLFPSKYKPSASSIAYDHKGHLWVGGASGLFFKSSTSDSLVLFSETFDNTRILDIEFIPSKKILAVGTTSEIFFINLENDLGPDIIQEYNYKNGFQGQEIAQDGFYMDGDDLFIPSATHLTKMDVSKISFDAPYSEVYIKSINDKPLEFNLQKDQEFLIEEGRNNFEIVFSSIGTGLPVNRMYQYKLQGYDQDWSSWDSEEKVNYQNLASGNYEFLLRGKKSNGKDFATSSTNIVVDLPIHKEPSFYKFALLGLLFFLIISLGLFYFYRRLSIQNKEKELSINYLKVKGLQSQMNPHFIFNVLGSIQSLMLNGKIEEADKYLISFSKLIRRFLDSSLTLDNQGNEIVEGIKDSPLADEIELLEIYTRFEELQLGNKFTTTIEIDKSVDVEQECIPPMIIQPFVENAIKHGFSNLQEKGVLKIRFQEKEDVLICTIDDNGIGREKAALQKKKKKFYHKSLGHVLVFDRIKILNKIGYEISHDVIDKTKGTRVQLKFSKNNHL